MQTQTIDLQGWTLRVRPAEGQNVRLLVMLHGLTGDENSMWVFARRFPQHYFIIAPRAPHPANPQGFSWRPNPMTVADAQLNLHKRPALDVLLPAAEALMNLLKVYTASVKVEAQPFDVIGFSQGGAMVSVLGLVYPQMIDKMGVLAGFVPAGADEYVDKKVLTGKHVFVAHGTQDEMVPVERARDSMQAFERAGASITYCEDEVGHKLSSTCLRALETYLHN